MIQRGDLVAIGWCYFCLGLWLAVERYKQRQRTGAGR